MSKSRTICGPVRVKARSNDLLTYEGGDANEPASYTLRCGVGACGLPLGRLGQFSPDAEGRRCVSCPCGMCTVVDKDGQLVAVQSIEVVRMVRVAKVVGGDDP